MISDYRHEWRAAGEGEEERMDLCLAQDAVRVSHTRELHDGHIINKPDQLLLITSSSFLLTAPQVSRNGSQVAVQEQG